MDLDKLEAVINKLPCNVIIDRVVVLVSPDKIMGIIITDPNQKAGAGLFARICEEKEWTLSGCSKPRDFLREGMALHKKLYPRFPLSGVFTNVRAWNFNTGTWQFR